MKLLASVLVFLEFTQILSFYYYAKQNEKRCFGEELPSDTILTVFYTVQAKNLITKQMEEHQDLGINVQVMSQEGKQIISKFHSKSGKLGFHSDHEGSLYTICVTAQAKYGHDVARTMDQNIMIKLEFKTGNQEDEQAKDADKSKIGHLEKRIRVLVEQTDQIIREQSLQKKREEAFRSISGRTSSRILFWAAIQIVLLVLTSFWQIHHLRKFFISRKIM